MKSEVTLPGQLRAPLPSAFRSQGWKGISFPPGISCLGGGKLVRDSDLDWEFSVSIKMPSR